MLCVRQRPQFNDVYFHSIELIIFRGLIWYKVFWMFSFHNLKLKIYTVRGFSKTNNVSLHMSVTATFFHFFVIQQRHACNQSHFCIHLNFRISERYQFDILRISAMSCVFILQRIGHADDHVEYMYVHSFIKFKYPWKKYLNVLIEVVKRIKGYLNIIYCCPLIYM